MTGKRRSLEELENRADFVRRHIGPGSGEVEAMLQSIGFATLDKLIDAAVPSAIRHKGGLNLPGSRSEADVLGELRALAGRNKPHRSMIGLGYHDTHTPPVILRNVLENPGWYTAYTPYQPEISQGRLEALLNFQTMIMDLSGMALANASLLDEATAAAEAMTLCKRAGKSDSNAFFVDNDCHPQTIAVLRTRAEGLGFEIIVGGYQNDLPSAECFGVLLQYPSSSGAVRDYRESVEAAHAKGALVVVAADLLALTLLTPPGEWGADIAVGSAQRFGVPMGFGGPHAGYFATREEYRRMVPGRIVGVSIDEDGNPAYRLALQTREQHIRREKATSNICTAQVLLAVMAGFYAVYYGPEGLKTIAGRVARMTSILADGLGKLGFPSRNEAFFDTLTLAVDGDAGAIAERARTSGINLRLVDANTIGISIDETTTASEIEAVWGAFAGKSQSLPKIVDLDKKAESGLPKGLARDSAFLQHPVFSLYRSETEMLRYLKRLQDKDIALDRSMIPLGSCTMKLNAVTEMEAITWPEFAAMHPFAPLGQAQGTLALIAELESWLGEITGFDEVSLQPNAGSQGEFSGLRAIERYHQANGQGQRDICLIPSSAHGTNPASAVLAGLKVVVIGCDDAGNIDVGDLRAKAEANAERLAALMVTYPSTHGVFETAIVEICNIVHHCGGQVYFDGANLNALVGLAKPGLFGADVAHLNLHKTFCIPHGGGGPGIGPIGVRAHLAPYLPNHPLVPEAGPQTGMGPVAAAPWGSAGILPISWAYIALMGGTGLKRATETAILNANYIAKRLSRCFPVVYTGPGGLVAHECIIDLRDLKESAGVSVDDVAKRLMDYGFHAPTMSWPVTGTLMIEPTESEAKVEIDRFCDAMIAIREEIARVEKGEWPRDDNPLVNAPHTATMVMADKWDHPYTREQAAIPAAGLRQSKYWPPVARIDQVHGDRHFACACPPLEAYQDAAE
ncbi:MAG: aminomethyl-transferring glycine dehydrogenase [Alphaproteobacteria bacterium]|nr:aminomethyl-transferring glycine dehydrogenase [Alphaproteobacteria bacterium]